MKKALLTFLLVIPGVAFSQVDDVYGSNNTRVKKEKTVKPVSLDTLKGDRFVYAQIVGTGRMLSTKVDVEIDYGQEKKLFNPDDNRIMDEQTGKAKKFNSMVDAMNYMGVLGWEFVQAYVVTTNGSNVYHWLMKRYVNGIDNPKALPVTRRDLKQSSN